MRFHTTLITAVVLLLTSAAFAEDKKPAPIDGTWTWTYKLRDGTEGEAKLKLKQEGDAKLTGSYVARDGAETPIEDGKIAGDELSFTVNRMVGDQKMKFEYKGKLAGDTITGKIMFGREKPTPHDWEAKRAK
jgi:hypothetical protein